MTWRVLSGDVKGAVPSKPSSMKQSALTSLTGCPVAQGGEAFPKVGDTTS